MKIFSPSKIFKFIRSLTFSKLWVIYEKNLKMIDTVQNGLNVKQFFPQNIFVKNQIFFLRTHSFINQNGDLQCSGQDWIKDWSLSNKDFTESPKLFDFSINQNPIFLRLKTHGRSMWVLFSTPKNSCLIAEKINISTLNLTSFLKWNHFVEKNQKHCSSKLLAGL